MSHPHIVVVDLDGTLCNSAHREHLARAKEWDQFHALLGDDEPWPDVKEMIKLLERVDTVIVGLTGRNQCYMDATIKWLGKYDIDLDMLLMRPNDNFQPDHELKPLLLDEYLSEIGKTHSDVWFILEDRDKVVEAWRNLGHNCWQPRPGGF